MELKDFLAHMNSGKTIISGSETHQYMCMLSQEALKVTLYGLWEEYYDWKSCFF